MKVRFTDPNVYRTPTRNLLAALEFSNECNWSLHYTFENSQGDTGFYGEARVWGLGDGNIWIKRDNSPHPLTLEVIALGTVNAMSYELYPSLRVILIKVRAHEYPPTLFFEEGSARG